MDANAKARARAEAKEEAATIVVRRAISQENARAQKAKGKEEKGKAKEGSKEFVRAAAALDTLQRIVLN